MINLLLPLPSFPFTWNALTLPLQFSATLYSLPMLLKIYFFWKHLQANPTCLQLFQNFMMACNDFPIERPSRAFVWQIMWGGLCRLHQHLLWINSCLSLCKSPPIIVSSPRGHIVIATIVLSFIGLPDGAGDKTVETLFPHSRNVNADTTSPLPTVLLPSAWNSLYRGQSLHPHSSWPTVDSYSLRGCWKGKLCFLLLLPEELIPFLFRS